MGDTLLFAFALFDTGGILFLLVYYVITLSDLECDYLNAQQCCSRLNVWNIPKLAAHCLLTVLFLLCQKWLLLLLNIPVAAWIIYEYVNVPSGNFGVYDPTEINNRGQLRRHMRDCLIYLGFYLISFFIYLYCMIIALLQGNPIAGQADEVGDF